MPKILYVAKLTVDRGTGLPVPELAGQSVQIVKRGTTTPVTIWEDEAGSLVIPSSNLTVSPNLFIPAFWVEDSDMPVAALGGGIEVPLETTEGIAKRLDALEPALLSASGAAVASAETVATLKQWVDQGITRRNLVANPRAVGRAFGTAGATGTQTDETSGGPLGFGYRKLVLTATTTTSPITVAPSATGAAAAAVVAGRTYTFSAYSRMVGGPSATQGGIDVNWYTSAGVAAGNDSAYQGVLVNGVWTRHSKTVVAPATAAFALVTARFSATAGLPVVGAEYGATGFMIEDAAVVGSYFDGSLSSPPQYRANRWSGSENASVSEQLDMSAITDQKLPAGGTMGQALVKASNADRDVAWGTVAGGGGGTNVHGLLSGLDQDDHPQYLNNTRGDGRYYTKSQVDTAVNNAASAQSSNDRNRANHTGTQPIASITGLQDTLDGLGGTAVNSVAGKTGTVTLVSSDISDTGATGREIMGATTAAAVRTAAGAAATSHTHTASQVGATATGQGLMTATDAAAARGVIGAGTSSLELGTTASTALRGNAIVLNPSTITGIAVGTLVART